MYSIVIQLHVCTWNVWIKWNLLYKINENTIYNAVTMILIDLNLIIVISNYTWCTLKIGKFQN